MSTPTDAGLAGFEAGRDAAAQVAKRRWDYYVDWAENHTGELESRLLGQAGVAEGIYTAIRALVPAEPAPSPASEPVAVNPAAAAFGRALSDLPALALAAGCFVAIKVTELKK